MALWFRAKPEVLKAKRENLGSQEDLIGLVNTVTGKPLSRVTYGFIEKGKQRTRDSVALAIAKILNCKVNEIFETDEPLETEAQ